MGIRGETARGWRTQIGQWFREGTRWGDGVNEWNSTKGLWEKAGDGILSWGRRVVGERAEPGELTRCGEPAGRCSQVVKAIEQQLGFQGLVGPHPGARQGSLWLSQSLGPKVLEEFRWVGRGSSWWGRWTWPHQPGRQAQGQALVQQQDILHVLLGGHVDAQVAGDVGLVAAHLALPG